MAGDLDNENAPEAAAAADQQEVALEEQRGKVLNAVSSALFYGTSERHSNVVVKFLAAVVNASGRDALVLRLARPKNIIQSRKFRTGRRGGRARLKGEGRLAGRLASHTTATGVVRRRRVGSVEPRPATCAGSATS